MNFYYNTILRSFYSSDLYSNVSEKRIKYFILLAILSFFIALNSYYSISNIIFDQNNVKFQNIINQLPELKIENGIVSLNENQPYFIKSLNHKNKILAIDTYNKLDIKQAPDLNILVDKKFIKFKLGGSIKTFSVDILCKKLFDTDNLTINKEFVIDYLQHAKTKVHYSIILVILLMATISLFISSLVRIILFSIIITIILSFTDKKISFNKIFNLNILALIPATIINIILIKNLDIFLSLEAINQIYVIISFGYLIFAIRSAIRENKTNLKNL